MFNFGRSYGFILGVLAALNIPYQVVPPREWKKEFGLNSDKAKSIEVCHRLFPNVDLKRTERCKTDSDGKAESVLIAEWCRRKM
jgi:crossover junction endodeoxyribonuclease RuvC